MKLNQTRLLLVQSQIESVNKGRRMEKKKRDRVEVVRCKDCALTYLKAMQMYCSKMVGAVRSNGYCSYGRREKD